MKNIFITGALAGLALLGSTMAWANNDYVYGHCQGFGEKHDVYVSSVYRVKEGTHRVGISNAFNDHIRAEFGDFVTRITCSTHADSYGEATRDRTKDLADLRTGQYDFNVIIVNFVYYED